MLAAAHDHAVIRDNRTKRIFSVADPGKGPGAPLFLVQTEAQRAEKNLLGDRAPTHLRVLISGSECPPRSDPALTSLAQSFG